MNRTEAIKTMNFFRNRFLEISDRARGDAKLQDSCREGIEAAREKRKELTTFRLRDICRKPRLNETDAEFLLSKIGYDILDIEDMGYHILIDFDDISKAEFVFVKILENFLLNNRISFSYCNRNEDIKQTFKEVARKKVKSA